MARNKFPGYCYCCGKFVPVGYGHFERHYTGQSNWRIKCVKCASGRDVKETDKIVQRTRTEAEKWNESFRATNGLVLTIWAKSYREVINE